MTPATTALAPITMPQVNRSVPLSMRAVKPSVKSGALAVSG
jgi:hypothetical protein